MTEEERKDLRMALSVMKEMHITLLETPVQFAVNEKQVVEINFQPQIERLICYKDIPLCKKLSEKTRILMLNLLPGLSKQERQFSCIEKYDEINRRKRNTPSKAVGGRLVIFRFQEGNNTPISYALKMNYFFQ